MDQHRLREMLLSPYVCVQTTQLQTPEHSSAGNNTQFTVSLVVMDPEIISESQKFYSKTVT